MAITTFKVVQGQRFWYQWKAHIRLPISDCTVSKLQLIICKILARDSPENRTIVSSFVWTQYRNVKDRRRTDRRTESL